MTIGASYVRTAAEAFIRHYSADDGRFDDEGEGCIWVSGNETGNRCQLLVSENGRDRKPQKNELSERGERIGKAGLRSINSLP